MSKDTTDKEAIERFDNGLRLASSRARELGRLQRSKHWLSIAKGLDEIRVNGVKMAEGKALSREEVLKKTDARQKYLSTKLQQTTH